MSDITVNISKLGSDVESAGFCVALCEHSDRAVAVHMIPLIRMRVLKKVGILFVYKESSTKRSKTTSLPTCVVPEFTVQYPLRGDVACIKDISGRLPIMNKR